MDCPERMGRNALAVVVVPFSRALSMRELVRPSIADIASCEAKIYAGLCAGMPRSDLVMDAPQRPLWGDILAAGTLQGLSWGSTR